MVQLLTELRSVSRLSELDPLSALEIPVRLRSRYLKFSTLQESRAGSSWAVSIMSPYERRFLFNIIQYPCLPDGNQCLRMNSACDRRGQQGISQSAKIGAPHFSPEEVRRRLSHVDLTIRPQTKYRLPICGNENLASLCPSCQYVALSNAATIARYAEMTRGARGQSSTK